MAERRGYRDPVSDERCLSRYGTHAGRGKAAAWSRGCGKRRSCFFGRIRPYKGIEYLLAAFKLLSVSGAGNYRLIVAGEPKKGSEEYLHRDSAIRYARFQSRAGHPERIQFIPDEEMELYFKAADVLVLPYKEIFQSGVLFLAYSFGLPVVATDVGSFREDIVEGVHGISMQARRSGRYGQSHRDIFRQ